MNQEVDLSRFNEVKLGKHVEIIVANQAVHLQGRDPAEVRGAREILVVQRVDLSGELSR
jgi:hypothetical protein